ncbi:phosphinothricin acetyltransferase [Capnocytophaga sp. G1920]|uniref:phosphinothricin acetyltransferase n=1 Tax=Capnocytophaga sp. G1920 TaxID=3448875 RepID=UPI003EDBFD5F
MWRVIYSVSPRTPEGGQAVKGDKPPLLHILRSRDTHTQLLLATFKGGMWRRKKRGVAITRGKQDEGMIFG